MNPLAMPLRTAQQAALMSAVMDLGKLSSNAANGLVFYALGDIEDDEVTFDDLRDSGLLAKVGEVAVARDIRLSPKRAKKLVALMGQLSLVTPVVTDDEGRQVFPYTLEGDKLLLAKVGDIWKGRVVTEIAQTEFGYDWIGNVICHGSIKVISRSGNEYPITDEGIGRRCGGIHKMWTTAMERHGNSLVLVAAVLMHHEDFARYTDGVPEKVFAILNNPFSAGLDQVTCDRIVFAANRQFWKRAYNAYVGLLEERRTVVTVSSEESRISPSTTGPARSSNFKNQLVRLLCSCYSSQHLRGHLGIMFGDGYRAFMPDRSVSLYDHAIATVDWVIRNNQLDQLQHQLLEDRRLREKEINEIFNIA